MSISFCRHDEFIKRTQISKDEKKAVICDFEGVMKQTRHNHCKCCRRIRIKQELSKKGICVSCKRFKDNEYYLRNDGLPVWYMHGDVRNRPNYHLPPELKNLSLAEKMLIQRVSPFVPLQHIKNGVMGLKGHVCAFEQNIDGFVSQLPRPIEEIDIIRVEQLIRTEIGSEHFHRKAFKVSRSKVVTALYWLKTHNPEYFDIEIDESNLEWIGKSDCAYIDVKTVVVQSKNDEKVGVQNENNDLGPTPDSAVTEEKDVFVSTGYVDNGGKSVLSPDDEEMNADLQNAVDGSSKKRNIHTAWPASSDIAVNEYSNLKIFARAFPWLFPGGFGDPNDFPQTLGDWGSLVLYYEDARFAQDPIFCFFALNYIIRHRNSTSGGFFIDKFHQNCPETLEDLKESVEKGDTSFINSLTYYSKRVKGSNSYWMQKRSEVYSWINHHVEVGNGAPTFFITLSCAEHYWADVALLLKDRLDQAGLDSSGCNVGAPGFSQLVNDYSIVVQEYFQERVIQWLNSVGRVIFDIEHYWIRYEFAPGRGQIHAHLLAISRNQDIYKLAHDIDKQNDPECPHTRATIFSDWAKSRFGLTASVSPGFDDIELDEQKMPTTMRFMDLENDEITHEKDIQLLLKAVQTHTCSGFCMRPSKNNKNKRVCRCGAGEEKTANECDTPGFPLLDDPAIKIDHKHSTKLYMPRNNERVVQSSTDLLQSWRANCDVQILIYKSDPKNPDVVDIARVTDYIVSYSCKGNATMKEEKEQNRNLVMNAEEITGDKHDLTRVCKQVMNRATTKRLISKQEAVVLLGELDLTRCTETIENVSISNSKQLRKADSGVTSTTMVDKYTKRPKEDENLSLYEFFHKVKNKGEKNRRGAIIPHFVGVNGVPKFPVTQEYAKQQLIIHKPWRNYPKSNDWVSDFNVFINLPSTPLSAKLTYQRVHVRWLQGTQGYEPKADCYDNSTNPISMSDEELIDLLGFNKKDGDDFDDSIMKNMDRGLHHEWDKDPKVCFLSETTSNDSLFHIFNILTIFYISNLLKNIDSHANSLMMHPTWSHLSGSIKFAKNMKGQMI